MMTFQISCLVFVLGLELPMSSEKKGVKEKDSFLSLLLSKGAPSNSHVANSRERQQYGTINLLLLPQPTFP